MTRTMHAAVVEQFGKPLVLREFARPTAGPGQILVKTEACGVCHTDLHAANGDWPVKPTLPFIPGHEAIGRVVEVGAGVTIVREGDRVGVPWLYSACGHCEHCLSAWQTVCGEAQFGGYTKNGGSAEYVLADPSYVAHIPAGLSPTEAAPLICAGVTTYKGIKETKVKAGDWIAISGAGGLGHLAIQYAKIMGLRVCAIDVDDEKLALARTLAPISSSTVLVGLPPGDFPVPLFDVVGQLHHHPRLVRRHPRGHGRMSRLRRRRQGQGRHRASLSDINDVFDRLEHGKVAGRVVLDFADAVGKSKAGQRVLELA
jgi:propanol-preferring alcohol dehydrogenase